MAISSGRAAVLPEVLAPAGDRAALAAAIRAGADAVYFGLGALNARARATNFGISELADVVAELHRHEVKAYVALNTLVFDSERALLEESVEACVKASVDALIMQDLGAVRRVRELAPELTIHASTQMTCTDAGSVEFAAALGVKRVVLARELSLTEIGAIARATQTELEVFVHGALCVAYSGQCLTSEAFGGRSANRGACAQACRLPYELYVDGVQRDLGERAYLLSPEDLEASALVPELWQAGVRSLKIEGRLKGAEYVGAVTSLYRRAVNALSGAPPPTERLRGNALQTFTRGSGPGFLRGVDHQRLVEGRSSDHRGTLLGHALGTSKRGGRIWLELALERGLGRGDGLLVEGGLAGSGEIGGRVWAIEQGERDVREANAGDRVEVWLGPGVPAKAFESGSVQARRVFLTHDPRTEAEIRRELAESPEKLGLRFDVAARPFAPLCVRASTARGRVATWQGTTPLAQAHGVPTTRDVIADKLGRLGETPYRLEQLELDLAPDVFVPVSELNHARRALVETLGRPPVVIPGTSNKAAPGATPCETMLSTRPSPEPGLFALCRNLEQARGALAAGVRGVYLDFLELTGTGRAFRALREEFPEARLGVAPPRIRKPGEEKIDRYLDSLSPDYLLVRGLGALREAASAPVTNTLRLGDFSLNVTSQGSAAEVLSHGLCGFTPAFDLDGVQLVALAKSGIGRFAEVVVHHPMPLFHMEHCVYAALLSNGSDYTTCGRPCEKHSLELRDRSGRAHPVIADVGCRNTVFHGSSQSAAALIPELRAAGVGRFRIEFVRESAQEVTLVVSAYLALLAGAVSGREAWQRLRAESGYGVVRGSLRVVS
jgi:putative protease